MTITAKLNYLRISPRKVRLVANLIRGKTAKEAQTLLNFAIKQGSKPLLKLLKSAVANAEHNFQADEENLYISKILVNEGPKLKRWRPRARGQAYEIQKKTSHIFLVLEEIKIKKKPKKIIASRTLDISGVPPVTKKAKKIEKLEIPSKERKILKEQPEFEREAEIKKPKPVKGIQRVFRRKAF